MLVRYPLESVPFLHFGVTFVPDLLLLNFAHLLLIKVGSGGPGFELGGATRHLLHACNVFGVVHIKVVVASEHRNTLLLHIDCFID